MNNWRKIFARIWLSTIAAVVVGLTIGAMVQVAGGEFMLGAVLFSLITFWAVEEF